MCNYAITGWTEAIALDKFLDETIYATICHGMHIWLESYILLIKTRMNVSKTNAPSRARSSHHIFHSYVVVSIILICFDITRIFCNFVFKDHIDIYSSQLNKILITVPLSVKTGYLCGLQKGPVTVIFSLIMNYFSKF